MQGRVPRTRDGHREAQEQTARWVEEFLAPGYGPHGGVKLLAAGDSSTWVESPALALGDAPSADPGLEPYRDLARRVSTHAGDQATTAVLLAARLVRYGSTSGLPRAALVDGLRLARRQALAVLTSIRLTASAESTLASVSDDSTLAKIVVRGLLSLGPSIALDDVAVRAEPVASPQWSHGLVVEPQGTIPERTGAGGVLLLAAAWKMTPRSEGVVLRLRQPMVRRDWTSAGDSARRDAVKTLELLGVRFVACSSSIDDDIVALLQDRGILSWTDVPLSALRRLERATAARRVASLSSASAADVSQATWARRPRPLTGWLLQGSGPTATLIVPATSKPARDAAVEAAERMLRAAGFSMASPGALPGGGQWQRAVAADLRRSADAAPGNAPLAIQAAARAFAELGNDLVRNAGGDPLSTSFVAGAASIKDAEACVRLAVKSAFDTAMVLLRLDGTYSKRASAPAALRGGLGPSGSLLGIPGDNPPLM